MKKIILIIQFISLFCLLNGQVEKMSNLKNWQLIGYAESAERAGDVYSAIDFYSEYYKRNNKNEKVSLKLADLYFRISDYKSAKPVYSDLYDKNNKKYSETLFKIAKILKSESRFDTAISCFEYFRDYYLHKFSEDQQALYNYLIEFEIQGCEVAYDHFKNDRQKKIRVRPLNETINTAHKDYSPIIWNDTMIVYSSLNSDTIPLIKVEDPEHIPSERFYAASMKGSDWYGGLEAPLPFYNFDSLASSDGVFSPDGKRFYFTVKKYNKYGKQIGAIYESRKIDGIWYEPVKLNENINHEKFTSINPAVGTCYDSRFDILYFATDRPGVGGYDIWYAVYDKDKDEYRKAHNAGSYLNTPANEVTPFFDIQTHTLYFSSDGLPGYGGYDIYKSIGETVNWTTPKNIGTPFNSPYNDVYYVSNKENTLGFLVSNRNEGKILKSPHCCFDIFTYEPEEDSRLEVTGNIFETDSTYISDIIKGNKSKTNNKNEELYSAGTVVDLHVENKMDGRYILISKDTTNNRGEFNFKVEKDQNYKLTIKKDKFNKNTIKFSTSNLEDKIISFEDITIVPVENKPISINNIYFDFNKWELSHESVVYIDTTLVHIMKKYKDIVVELSAHTDGKGDENYNLELSKKRAERVVDYMLSQGIDRSRMIAKGYGEAKPLYNEYFPDGTDNPDAREKNRRIEFRIVGLVIQE
jgi:OOP family OmpA-OmpF porin